MGSSEVQTMRQICTSVVSSTLETIAIVTLNHSVLVCERSESLLLKSSSVWILLSLLGRTLYLVFKRDLK